MPHAGRNQHAVSFVQDTFVIPELKLKTTACHIADLGMRVRVHFTDTALVKADFYHHNLFIISKNLTR